MITTLVKHGNDLVLLFDEPMMEMLQITPDTPLEVTTDGKCLLITPVRDKTDQKRLRKSQDQP